MRAEKSIGSFLTGMGSYAAVLATGMVATPWLIRWLGSSVYGEYRLILDWLGYLTLLDLALPDTMVSLLATPVARGETEAALQALVAGVRAYVRLLPLKIIGALILIAAISRLIPAASDARATLRLACAIGAASSLLGFFLPFRTLLDVQQRGYWVNLLLALQAVIVAALSLAFAHMRWGLPGQALAFFFGGLPFLAVVTFAALRSYPGLARAMFRASLDPTTWSALWKMNRPNWVASICSRLSLMTDNIIVGLLMSPVNVTSFAVTQRLIVAAQGQLYSIGSSSWAGLAELRARGQNHHFRNKALELTSLVTTFGMIVLAPIAAFNPHFISLWLGRAQYAGDAVTWLACANAIVLALVALWSWNFAALGINHVLVPQYIASTVANVIISVVATRLWGMPGPLLGTLVANSLTALWIIPRKMQEHFDVPARALGIAALRPVGILAPTAAALWIYARRSHFPGWGGLVFELAAGALLQAVLAWVLVLSEENRGLWLNRARRFRDFTAAAARR